VCTLRGLCKNRASRARLEEDFYADTEINIIPQPLKVFIKIFVREIRDCAKFYRERQSTYNVTLRRVCATTVAVEKQYVLYILSV
jgi:hypothetical protein